MAGAELKSQTHLLARELKLAPGSTKLVVNTHGDSLSIDYDAKGRKDQGTLHFIFEWGNTTYTADNKLILQILKKAPWSGSDLAAHCLIENRSVQEVVGQFEQFVALWGEVRGCFVSCVFDPTWPVLAIARVGRLPSGWDNFSILSGFMGTMAEQAKQRILFNEAKQGLEAIAKRFDEQLPNAMKALEAIFTLAKLDAEYTKKHCLTKK